MESTYIDYPGGRLYVRYWGLDTGDPPILLLHGYSFTSDVWMEIGLLSRLEVSRVPFLAPDMPYGMRVTRTRGRGGVEGSLEALEALLEWSRARTNGYLLVGASLGGYIALEHLARGGKPRGMVLIAPVRTGLEHVRKALSRFNGPILYIWGTRDTIVGREEIMEALKHTLRGRLEVYEDAGHPAYLDMPERFASDVLSLYREAIKGG